MSPGAALRDVQRATVARARADADAARLQEAQAVAIRAALTAGVAVADLVRVTGLSPARVYQIRDGRR